jgi:phage/plasmid primase-like uncharacterized protein
LYRTHHESKSHAYGIKLIGSLHKVRSETNDHPDRYAYDDSKGIGSAFAQTCKNRCTGDGHELDNKDSNNQLAAL